MNRITEKWEKTGLLDGIKSSNLKDCCAKSLNQMENILIKNKSKKNSQKIACTLLPIVRRLYSENIKNIPKMKNLYNDYVNFLSGDLEAFLCESYLFDFIKRNSLK